MYSEADHSLREPLRPWLRTRADPQASLFRSAPVLLTCMKTDDLNSNGYHESGIVLFKSEPESTDSISFNKRWYNHVLNESVFFWS